MHTVKQLVPENGRMVTITRKSEYPFMTDLPGVLLTDVVGGRSGREKHKAGEKVWCVLLPSQEWLVTTAPHGFCGMSHKNGDTLRVNVDFALTGSK